MIRSSHHCIQIRLPTTKNIYISDLFTTSLLSLSSSVGFPSASVGVAATICVQSQQTKKIFNSICILFFVVLSLIQKEKVTGLNFIQTKLQGLALYVGFLYENLCFSSLSSEGMQAIWRTIS